MASGSEGPKALGIRSNSEERKVMGAEIEGEVLDVDRPLRSSTPISQSQFLAWKRQKDVDAAARRAEAAQKREEDIRAGAVQMNGRELFIHEPWVFDNTQY